MGLNVHFNQYFALFHNAHFSQIARCTLHFDNVKLTCWKTAAPSNVVLSAFHAMCVYNEVCIVQHFIEFSGRQDENQCSVCLQ